jgi:glycosyltransferase involved in cell wall biosynthesis
MLQQPYEIPTRLGTDGETEIYGFNNRMPLVPAHGLKSTVAFAVYLIRTVRRLRKFMRGRGINAVNIHFPSGQYYYFGLLRRWYGYPLMVSVHGSDIQFGFETAGLNRWAYRRLLSSADVVTGVSRELLTQAENKVPGLHAMTVVVPGGAPDAFFTVAETPVREGERPYILCVARLHPVKGHDTLLQAFRLVKDKDTTGCRLLLAGAGELEAEIRRQIEELGLGDDVIMGGNVKQTDLALMNRNAIFTVLASRSEGLPLTVIEAFATGKTVVATDVGGVKEIVQHGVTGLLVPANDPPALAEQMLWMLNHPDERQKMEARAKALVAVGYTWDANADKYVALLSDLVSRRP